MKRRVFFGTEMEKGRYFIPQFWISQSLKTWPLKIIKFSEHLLLFLNLCAGWCSCIGQREEVVWGMLGLSDQTGSVPVREVGGLVFGRPCVEAALLLLPDIPRRVRVANHSWYLRKWAHYLGDLVRFNVLTDQEDLCVIFMVSQLSGCRSLNLIAKSTV